MSLGGYPRAFPLYETLQLTGACQLRQQPGGGGGREMKIIQVVAFGPEDLPYAIPKQSYLHRSEISQHGS